MRFSYPDKNALNNISLAFFFLGEKEIKRQKKVVIHLSWGDCYNNRLIGANEIGTRNIGDRQRTCHSWMWMLQQI
jgi:hypothetical protein